MSIINSITNFSSINSFKGRILDALEARLNVENDADLRDFVEEETEELFRKYLKNGFNGLDLDNIEEDENCSYKDLIVDRDGFITDCDRRFSIDAKYAGKKVRLVAPDGNWAHGFSVFTGVNCIMDHKGYEESGNVIVTLPWLAFSAF